MVGNIPGGNFLGGNSQGGSLIGGDFSGGNFPGGSFPDTQKYMGYPEKKNLNSLWHFNSCDSFKKIENILKRCVRIILDDYENHNEILLNKSRRETWQ